MHGVRRLPELLALLSVCSFGQAVAADKPPVPPSTAESPEPPPAEAPSPASPEPASHPPGSAAPDPDAWLHQAEGQARLGRVVEVQLEEAKSLIAHHKDLPAAQAYAAAYAFTPLQELLLKVGQRDHAAGQDGEAELIYERLLAENPEPLLHAQATALLQTLKARPGWVAADVDTTVKVYIERGKLAFHQADYAACIAAYSTAYALQDLPRLLFNMAQAYRRRGQSEQAFLMYQRFLQADPQTVLRHETEGYISELRVLAALATPQRQPRPRWRLATGGSLLGVGLAFVGLGAGALAINGQCVTTDATNHCALDLDPSGRPVLPRTSQLYDTTALGTGFITTGALLSAAGVVLLAIPGKRLRAEATLGAGSQSVGFTLGYGD